MFRNKQICFVTNRNNPKLSEKYPNILSFKLLGGFSVCFGSIETSKLSNLVHKRNNGNKLFRNKQKKTRKTGKKKETGKKNGKTLHFL
jgi:hypothetical protein